MSAKYLHEVLVCFGDCDPAGVVYFPQYFDWFHRTMETWFNEALEIPYAEILRSYGFPAVHTEADFRAPCKMGEVLKIELQVGELGRGSFRINYRIIGPEGVLKATGHTVVAMIGIQPGTAEYFKPVRIPSDLRTRIERFMSAV